MPRSFPHSRTSPGSGRRRLGLWLAGLLLLGEFIWLVSRFTTATLPESDQAWVRLMKLAGVLPQIGLAVLTILLLFRRKDAAKEPAQVPYPSRSRRSLIALVLAQIGAFVLLDRSTAGIFEEHLAGVDRPLLAIAIWAVLALVTTSLGVLLFLPAAALRHGLSTRAGVLVGVCVLGLTAWWAGQYAENELSQPLRSSTLWLADKLLGLFEPDYSVDVDRFELRTPNFWVVVAPQCSGFEGMGLMTVFSISYVWIFRQRLRSPRLLLLPLIGIAGVWLLNVVRLVSLVLIGAHVSVDLAKGGFHSLAGTFAFCLAALGLVVLSNRMSYFAAADEREQGSHEPDATAAYLTPLLLTVAFGMVISAFDEGGRALQPLKVIAPACALWFFRRSYPITFPKGWAAPLLLGAVVFALWLGIPELDALRGAPPTSPEQVPEVGRLLIQIAGFVCVVPLVEELAFRGYLMRRLTALEFEGLKASQVSFLAWAISALIFGVLHPHWVSATVAGVVFGYAYMRRGQLIDCIVAHAFTNLLLVVLALVTRDWSLVS